MTGTTRTTPATSPPPAAPPRRLDQRRFTARQRGHAEPSVAAFADWSLRFILFHGKRHSREMGLTEVGPFLESVANTEKDPVPALAASRDALDFLDRAVLHLDLGELPWPRPPRLLDQVHQVLRVRHDALSTEDCYVQSMTRFIRFHHKRHPRDMDAAEVERDLLGLWPLTFDGRMGLGQLGPQRFVVVHQTFAGPRIGHALDLGQRDTVVVRLAQQAE